MPCRSTHPYNVRVDLMGLPWGSNVSRLSPAGTSSRWWVALGVLPRGLIQRHHIGVEDRTRPKSASCRKRHNRMATPFWNWPPNADQPRGIALGRVTLTAVVPDQPPPGKHAAIRLPSTLTTAWRLHGVLTEPACRPILAVSWAGGNWWVSHKGDKTMWQCIRSALRWRWSGCCWQPPRRRMSGRPTNCASEPTPQGEGAATP